MSYCQSCNGKVPGILFVFEDSEDGKVYVQRCLDCCRYGSNRTAANHVSSLTWWRVYPEKSDHYFMITLEEAKEFIRRNQVTHEEPEPDSDECEDCANDDCGTCSDHCTRCQEYGSDDCARHRSDE